jgi:Domain of unknown function (DU1801)
MATTVTTPEEYLASLDEAQRTEIEDLHRFIRKTVPKLEPYIEAGILAYGRYHYRYASGREGDWCLVALAARKLGISLYLTATDERGYLAETWAPRLGKVDVGKSCIRARHAADIDRRELGKLLRAAASSGPPGGADA